MPKVNYDEVKQYLVRLQQEISKAASAGSSSSEFDTRKTADTIENTRKQLDQFVGSFGGGDTQGVDASQKQQLKTTVTSILRGIEQIENSGQVNATLKTQITQLKGTLNKFASGIEGVGQRAQGPRG